MIGLILSAIVLSGIGALAQRGMAALLGVRARLVLGTGPRLGQEGRTLGAIELRPIPLWAWTAIVHAREPVGRAIAALSAGPVAMLLVPFVVLVVAVIARGAEDTDPGPPLVVGTVAEGSPADDAGIVPGDVVLAVEGSETPDLASLIVAVRDRGGQATRVVIEHEGARRELVVTPLAYEDRALLGVTAQAARRAVDVSEAIVLAAGSVTALWRSLAPGDEDAPLTGPVGLTAPRRGTVPDGPTRFAVVAMAWTAVAPLWALLMTIGSAIAIARRGA